MVVSTLNTRGQVIALPNLSKLQTENPLDSHLQLDSKKQAGCRSTNARFLLVDWAEEALELSKYTGGHCEPRPQQALPGRATVRHTRLCQTLIVTKTGM